MTKLQLENKYGIHISTDYYFSPRRNKIVKEYVVYTADGCKWDCFRNLKAIETECRYYKDTFIDLKNRKEKTV